MNTYQPGSQIAGYRIHSLIGRGGMAVVYCAEDTRLGRKVALKLLSPQLADSEQFRQRFIRESRLAASLDHPNIVPIYEAGEADDQLFIAMRYVLGRDLKGVLAEQGGWLRMDLALRLFGQIGDALDAAHRAGLVHRDVKPANILVATEKRAHHALGDHVYLTDFGLTKRTSELSGGLTGTGSFLGTVDYVSPEQIQGRPVGPATDMYALGCMLFQCLTGQLPYRRDDDAALLWAHLAEMPPPVTGIRPELPAAVDAVVAHAMAKEPADRYASCEELLSDFERAIELSAPGPAATGRHFAESRGVPLPDVPTSSESLTTPSDVPVGRPAEPPGPPEAPLGPPEALPEPSGPRRRRTLRSAAIAAVALAVLATVLVAVLLTSRTAAPSRSPAALTGPTATQPTSSSLAAAPTPTPAPSIVPAAAVGVFSGLTNSSGIGLAFALDGGKATAYVCDGRTYEIWMQGTVNGDQVTMSGPGNSSLSGVVNGQALSGQITTPAGRIDFLAKAASPPAGVYKAEIQINGQDAYIGWAVLPDGTQLGAIDSGQGVTSAPRLTFDRSATPPTATFTLNGTMYRAEVAQAGQPLWPGEPSPTG